MAPRPHFWTWLTLAAAGAALLLWLSTPPTDPASTATATAQTEPRAAKLTQSKPSRRASTVRPTPPRSARGAASADERSVACEPYRSTACYGGNVHWFDSCGTVQAVETECGAGPCRAGACVDADWVARCKEPPHGRCDGDVVRLCDLGASLAIDCRAQGQVCRGGSEGAGCVALDPVRGCDFELPRCGGQVLERCLRGVLEQTDCSADGGACAEHPDQGATCLRVVAAPPPPSAGLCGPCGCEPSPVNTVETCNGLDDDNNGFVDDGVDCGSVAVDVAVGKGAYGEALIDAEGLQAELERANEVFSRSGSAIRFHLGDVSELSVGERESVDFEQLIPLVDAPDARRGQGELRVRLVFAGRLMEGSAPRLGVVMPFVTTTCGEILQTGGLRFDRALVAISEGRTPTTLAHELGHLLGLCHTHEHDLPAEPLAVDTGAVSPVVCGEACSYGGDAICDTPADREDCVYDPDTCGAQCPGGQRPDTSNVMSYYHLCRDRFSADQVQLMEHTLSLRRQWASCRDGACGCQPGDEECPVGMSCRPLAGQAQAAACGMDGPMLVGQACRGQADCSDRSLCIAGPTRSTCVRPCNGSQAGCTCTTLGGLPFDACWEDFGGGELHERASG